MSRKIQEYAIKDIEVLKENIGGLNFILSHTVIAGGKYHDAEGECHDNEGFEKEVRELVKAYGKSSELLFHRGCKNRERFHAHAIISWRSDESGKRLIDRRVINRAFFNRIGSTCCQGCNQLKKTGNSNKCKTCGCEINQIMVKNREHLDNLRKYLKRREAEKEERDFDKVFEFKIVFEPAANDTEQTKKKKIATIATKRDAQKSSSTTLDEDELQAEYEEELEEDLKIERELQKEKWEEMMKRMRDDRTRQHEWCKRNEKSRRLWEKIRKQYNEKERAAQNDVYKDIRGTFRCNNCASRCNIHAEHWNETTQKYDIDECPGSRYEQEDERQRKQTLTISVEENDGEEIDNTDDIFDFDYAPQLLYIIRGFVQHILND